MKLLVLVAFLGATAYALPAVRDVEAAESGVEAGNEEQRLTDFFREMLGYMRKLVEAFAEVEKLMNAGEEADPLKPLEDFPTRQVVESVMKSGFGKDLGLAFPIWGGLADAVDEEATERQKQVGFTFAGEALWELVNSDRAVPVLRAIANLIEEGNFFLPSESSTVMRSLLGM